MRRTPVLIAGGGPAGAVAALLLARRGVRPLVIERTRETGDALCGGFLSWRTLATLTAIGVPAAMLGGHPVRRMRLLHGGSVVERPLPGDAIGLSRRTLDTLLLAAAEGAGAAVERGIAIRAADATTLRLADGATIAGEALFLATGKHALRGLPRDAVPERDPTLGVRVRLAPSPTLARLVGDAIELHLFDRGYAGLVLHEDGSANLCMAVRRSRLDAAGYAPALLRALGAESGPLGERLACLAGDATIDAVANVPYGWRATDTPPGIFRLGDQAAVIPSLAGEGIGIAVASAVRAADAFVTGGPAAAPEYQRALARSARRPLAIAGLVRDAAERPLASRLLLAGARVPGLAEMVANWTRIG